jgi:hypothetical protein
VVCFQQHSRLVRELSVLILCFHRHSRFVPSAFNTTTAASDFVAGEHALAEAKAAAPQAPLPHSKGSFPKLGIPKPGVLCFHRHSRFVPSAFNTTTAASDFVAGEHALAEAKAAAPQAPLPHSKGSLPEVGILKLGDLCFHRHSRFVPAVLRTATGATDIVAAASLPSFSNDTSPEKSLFLNPESLRAAFCGLEALAPPQSFLAGRSRTPFGPTVLLCERFA